MLQNKLNDYISNRYPHWLEYAEYQAAMAHIPDESGDILNTVMESLLQKDPGELEKLLERKRKSNTHKEQEYAELDYYVLRMIKLNTQSPTSPYRFKTRTVPMDYNVDPGMMDMPDHDEPEPDAKMEILEQSRKAREILESLNIPDKDKTIFYWKFFGDHPLRSWPGPESYSTVCNTFNRVQRMMIEKIKNPNNERRPWTMKEIAYLRAEYPHMETMKIAVYLNRNLSAVKDKAHRLKLVKTGFYMRKRMKKNGTKR